MDVNWEGVVFIWICFLWPVLVTLSYLGWRGGRMQRKGRFFFASAAMGYVALVLGNVGAALFVVGYVKIVGDGNEAAESLVNVVTVVALVPMLGVSVLATHLLSQRFCREHGAQ